MLAAGCENVKGLRWAIFRRVRGAGPNAAAYSNAAVYLSRAINQRGTRNSKNSGCALAALKRGARPSAGLRLAGAQRKRSEDEDFCFLNLAMHAMRRCRGRANLLKLAVSETLAIG